MLFESALSQFPNRYTGGLSRIDMIGTSLGRENIQQDKAMSKTKQIFALATIRRS
jgi:hypothetical protein